MMRVNKAAKCPQYTLDIKISVTVWQIEELWKLFPQDWRIMKTLATWHMLDGDSELSSHFINAITLSSFTRLWSYTFTFSL